MCFLVIALAASTLLTVLALAAIGVFIYDRD